jgi:predicted DNA repair protein MutK
MSKDKEIKVETPKVEENKPINHGFFTELPSESKKTEVKTEKIVKKELKNNINLGEIPSEVLKSIQYPCIVRAFFYALDYGITYRVQKTDDVKSALSTLRDAIFNAALGKELPKGCRIETTKAYNTSSAFVLQNSVSLEEGVIDARIEAFECAPDEV